MATDRLKIYNGALGYCGERRLATLNDNVEGRRLLDEIWNDGGVRHCLEQGQWKFAMRMAQLDYDPAIAPPFGYTRAFPKPDDWVNTTGIWQDPYMTTPLLSYVDEAGNWFASLDTIYARWVSDDSGYGTNYAAWPSSFTEYVKAYFASKIVFKLTGSSERRDELLGIKQKGKVGILATNKLEALNRDAMADPTKFPPEGSWVKSRRAGRGSGRRDRGNPGSLIG